LRGVFLFVVSSAAVADERCEQLAVLNQQYIAVTLTSDQKRLKRKLIAWYKANCGKPLRASASG
jgi:hypothetical protein